MYPDETKQGWVEKYLQGASSKKIAASEGVAPRTVLLHLKKVGVQRRSPGRPKAHVGLSREEIRQRYHYKSKYGIDLAEYESLLLRQEGVCAICKQPPRGQGKNASRLHLDHCHLTGKVRGLLCRRCNPALGAFDDDIEKLQRAINYLRSHNG